MNSQTAVPEEDAQQPKVFISYAWTSDAHVEWVLSLATRLVNDGVDVVIDRWDLEPGQDKYHFMERMVNDSSINKVLVICDKRYAEKANDRQGGVGTESTIISQEVYNQVAQTKFLPVITEKEEEKNPYLPVFLKSRIYVDLSQPLSFSENYEELLRNIYGKPLYIKPTLGRAPTFLRDDAAPTQPTTHKKQTFENALMNNKPHAAGLLTDYFEALESVLEGLQIATRGGDKPFDEVVFESAQKFLPLRDEFVDLLLFVNRYGADPRLWDELRDFFSRSVRFINLERYGQRLDDNYRFILWELLLYSVTALVKGNRHAEAGALLSAPYSDFDRLDSRGRNYINGYGVFAREIPSLDEERKRRLQIRLSEPLGGMLGERATHPKISFSDLRDVDYALFLRYWLAKDRHSQLSWSPRTIPYSRDEGTLPLFARARAKKEFAGLKHLLDVDSKQDLVERIAATSATRPGGFPNFESIWGDADERHRQFINLDQLDTI